MPVWLNWYNVDGATSDNLHCKKLNLELVL